MLNKTRNLLQNIVTDCYDEYKLEGHNLSEKKKKEARAKARQTLASRFSKAK